MLTRNRSIHGTPARRWRGRAAMAALACLLVGGAANAAPAAPAVRISYADLNLSRPADQRILRSRIHRASTRLCRAMGVSPVQYIYCVQELRNSARPQLRAAIATHLSRQLSA